ncbi:hypothetical protein L6164_023040 [Bauhinia variegata]|uniref:Uncharacterized protein n=1 Tax=Bauhinia variegata TaxID=167791 RepID=A0ACB9MIX3_BAUVA|nr:hypothetical protein L6164_023040 [Bauhinia variegata]
MGKIVEILDLGVKFAGRFYANYPQTGRKYYHPPPVSDDHQHHSHDRSTGGGSGGSTQFLSFAPKAAGGVIGTIDVILYSFD